METNRTALEYVTAEKKIHSLLGLSQRGGHIASGEFMTEREVKSGRAALVILAEDSSENTRKKFCNMCEYYEVPIYIYGDKELALKICEIAHGVEFSFEFRDWNSGIQNI